MSGQDEIYKFAGSLLSVSQSLGELGQIITNVYSYEVIESQKPAIKNDLPRTVFMKCTEDQNAQFYNRYWLEKVKTDSYIQGYMTGALCPRLFLLAFNESRSDKDFSTTLNKVSFGYVDNEGQHCGFTLLYLQDDPKQWVATLAKKVGLEDQSIAFYAHSAFFDEIEIDLSKISIHQKMSNKEAAEDIVKSVAQNDIADMINLFFDGNGNIDIAHFNAFNKIHINDKELTNPTIISPSDFFSKILYEETYDEIDSNFEFELEQFDFLKKSLLKTRFNHKMSYKTFVIYATDLIKELECRLSNQERLVHEDRNAYQQFCRLLKQEVINIGRQSRTRKDSIDKKEPRLFDISIAYMNKKISECYKAALCSTYVKECLERPTIEKEVIDLNIHYEPSKNLINQLKGQEKNIIDSFDRVEKLLQGRNPDAHKFLQKLKDLILAKLRALFSSKSSINEFGIFTCQKVVSRLNGHYSSPQLVKVR